MLHVQVAHFQADVWLNLLHSTGRIDFIMSKDVDYPVQNGDGCVAIKEFTGTSATISCTSRATLEDALSSLGEDVINPPQVTNASCPLFEGLSDRRL